MIINNFGDAFVNSQKLDYCLFTLSNLCALEFWRPNCLFTLSNLCALV